MAQQILIGVIISAIQALVAIIIGFIYGEYVAGKKYNSEKLKAIELSNKSLLRVAMQPCTSAIHKLSQSYLAVS